MNFFLNNCKVLNNKRKFYNNKHKVFVMQNEFKKAIYKNKKIRNLVKNDYNISEIKKKNTTIKNIILFFIYVKKDAFTIFINNVI